MNLTVILGDDRAEPATFKFAPRTFAISLSLQGLKSAIAFLSPETELPRVLEGTVEGRLTKNGEQDFSFSASVLEALRIEVDDAFLGL